MMLKRLNTIIPVMCNLVVLFIDNMMLYPHTSSNYSGFKFDVLVRVSQMKDLFF